MLLYCTPALTEPEHWSTNFANDTYPLPSRTFLYCISIKLMVAPGTCKASWIFLYNIHPRLQSHPFSLGVKQCKGYTQHAFFRRIWGKLLSDPIYPVFCNSQQIACQPTNHVRSPATSGIVVLCILVHRKYFSSSSSFPTYLYGFPLGEIFEKTSSFQHMRTSTTMAKLHHLLRWWWLCRLLRVKTKTFRSHHEN